MYSCLWYSQTTDKGNEPDSKRMEYTDKGKVLKSPEKKNFFSSFDEDIEHGISFLDVSLVIQGNKAETSCYFCQLYQCSVKQLREYDNGAE